MTYAAVEQTAGRHGLIITGALHPHECHDPRDATGTLILLGTGPTFWPIFTASAEGTDGEPDPVDRWSKRVIGALAEDVEAECRFPSDGPPYPPFIDWALQSGRAFQSPVGMLVHDAVGMMISYRGALLFREAFPVPAPAGAKPCEICASRACTSACPIGALSADAPYDVASCHQHLDSDAGQDCMQNGCAARRACPLSAGARREPAQSALHMRSFHPS